jgi:hypothetical protein
MFGKECGITYTTPFLRATSADLGVPHLLKSASAYLIFDDSEGLLLIAGT